MPLAVSARLRLGSNYSVSVDLELVSPDQPSKPCIVGFRQNPCLFMFKNIQKGLFLRYGDGNSGENPRLGVTVDVAGPMEDVLIMINVPMEMTSDRVKHLVSPLGEVLFYN